MNNPMVITVIGSDTNRIIGLIKVFTIAKSPATIIAVQKFFISTPVSNLEVIKTATLFNNQIQIMLVTFSFC